MAIKKILKQSKLKRRVISKEQAEDFASKNGLTYLEVSAKTYENVDDAF